MKQDIGDREPSLLVNETIEQGVMLRAVAARIWNRFYEL